MSEAGQPSSELHYQRHGTLVLRQETPMPVDPADWTRIRRNVERLGEPLVERASTWSATAAGALITCVAALITFHATSDDEPASVIVLFGLGAVFSALFAVCFYLVGKDEKERAKINARTVCEDMDDVERRCRPESKVQP